MAEPSGALLRAIPAVSEVLDSGPGRALAAEFGPGAVRFELRALLELVRSEIRGGRRQSVPPPAALAEELRGRLVRLARPEGRRAINATGILLHTGLGRAPLCSEATAALSGLGGYSLLQADPQSGERSLREEKVERLLVELTGCEAATVVNNNAAATMLVLSALAAGREAIISRGQLIEIGGAFRLPDVLARSGAIMREVGTTNRTHLRDYEAALSPATGAIIHVHTSNYRVRGFAGTPDIAELCTLGRRAGVPVIDDLGSGALVPLSTFGLPDEPLVSASLAAGANVACFSGDKLICGPQSGIICGRKAAVERIRKDPFARMFRVDKLTIAALEATLLHFLDGESWKCRLPLYRMMARPMDELRAQADGLAAALAGLPAVAAEAVEETAYLGSGSLPDQGLPTLALALRPEGLSAGALAVRLRTGLPSVFGRIRDGRLLLDMRTVFPEEAGDLAAALRRALGAP
ncbi:MAG TPA: L-seryl-tRNA(Sec) selenium transferase [Planctomycetota bacterium]|nr:L-seryl-tRNA(Sec) selenium transferase [Planctomycetota bacterium]